MTTNQPSRAAKRRLVRDTYEQIRAAYFPRWDRERRWRVCYTPSRRYWGKCRDGRGFIDITRWESDAELRKILVHEIAHAVTSGYHGKVWMDRMRRAAATARRLGDHDLSRLLVEEVAAYEAQPAPRVREVYVAIEDAVLDMPDADYPTVRRAVADYAGYTLKEFDAKYRRARRVWEKAHESALEDKRINEAFMAAAAGAEPSAA